MPAFIERYDLNDDSITIAVVKNEAQLDDFIAAYAAGDKAGFLERFPGLGGQSFIHMKMHIFIVLQDSSWRTTPAFVKGLALDLSFERIQKREKGIVLFTADLQRLPLQISAQFCDPRRPDGLLKKVQARKYLYN